MAPTVGGKHFSYSKAGREAAHREAKRTGMPMKEKDMGMKGGKPAGGKKSKR